MPVHQWLTTEWPTSEMPQPQLRERIERLLTMQNMCVMSTIGGHGGPVATPIEFYADGLDLYTYPQPQSPKIHNIHRSEDRKVCAAVFMPYVGWASARGAQLFSKADLFEPGTPEHAHGLDVFRWEASAAELGRPMDRAPQGLIMRIRPYRITYTEHWLRKEGWAPRQVWKRSLDSSLQA